MAKLKIDISEDGVKIDETLIVEFEVSALKTILGDYRLAEKDEKDGEKMRDHKKIFWDECGLYAEPDDTQSFNELTIQFSKNLALQQHYDINKWLALNDFSGELYIAGKPYSYYLEGNDRKFFNIKVGNYKCYFTQKKDDNTLEKLSVSYEKPNPYSKQHERKKRAELNPMETKHKDLIEKLKKKIATYTRIPDSRNHGDKLLQFTEPEEFVFLLAELIKTDRYPEFNPVSFGDLVCYYTFLHILIQYIIHQKNRYSEIISVLELETDMAIEGDMNDWDKCDEKAGALKSIYKIYKKDGNFPIDILKKFDAIP